MFEFSENELENLLAQDVPYLDNTSFGLGISGKGRLKFYPKKDEIILCGVDECVKIAKIWDLEVNLAKANGDKIVPKEAFLQINGDKMALLRVSKTMQNLLEHASSVATYTRKMLENARKFSPDIALLGTRKTMPFAKKLLLKALITGGAAPHRYGLSDTILIFKEHRLFSANFAADFRALKAKFKEHKIIAEVENMDEAREFARLGTDILQCERFSCEDLAALVREMRANFPHILLSATGGVNLANAAQFAQTGVDMLVSTAMYRAEILDVKCEFGTLK